MKGGVSLNTNKEGLTAREKRFCAAMADGSNVREAARAAGYSQPDRAGAELMLRQDIAAELDARFAARAKNCRRMALAGYERLAFGSVSDAVRLMFEEDPLGGGFSGYDLFNVSEIRRPKDGAMEIKFFDRIRALEKLEAAVDDSETRLADFYSALMKSGEERDN